MQYGMDVWMSNENVMTGGGHGRGGVGGPVTSTIIYIHTLSHTDFPVFSD